MKTMIIKIIMMEMIVILIMMKKQGTVFCPYTAVKCGFKSSIIRVMDG